MASHINGQPFPTTLGEIKFMDMFPDAVPVNTWYDFDFHDCRIEVKDCCRNNWGRFMFMVDHHEQLVENNGMYFFVLKKKLSNREPKIIKMKWVPAVAINVTEDKYETVRSFNTNYDEREIFRLSWREIFP